ncbi:MAG: flavin reductase family protein [Spirochaetia bacterium]|jgi:flavin reductase (DIM6/NTAB) family NADH-FMN oxidoreductase RutF|uniref:Flavin reductase like domain-containing protein n=1 Tax=bioreactor metagenome TaxID=1076179 RepID=A0A644SW62_9ZZZZ|nr:flavin reductase family protein [Spirochaetia bacterium]MDD3820536.1 flavin reductase family protein [Spirochaetales bacterium]NLX45902.1 flavin reductase family protein [Treponema sp.]HOI22034.1 flavin reductase family protein [Spirochaetales bacterium]
MDYESQGYNEVPIGRAYSLQNAGGLVFVCTKGADGRYDLAPVAWCCPLDYDPVSMFIAVLDTSHKTWADILAGGVFALAFPGADQKELVERCGSVSGFSVDKYESFSIPSMPGEALDLRIPEGVAGWVECSLVKTIVQGTSGVVFGKALAARAREEWWKERLHYVGDSVYFKPGDRV